MPWYLRIGQLAHKEKNKTLVFLLDDQDLVYLDVLKSKDNLTVISVDENDSSSIPDHIKNLYVNSKLSIGLSREVECNYIRVKEKVMDEVSARRDIVSTVGFCYDLYNASGGTFWPSISSYDSDHYEFVKRIANEMIVVASVHDEDRSAVVQYIRDSAPEGYEVLNNIFDVVPSKERLRVWPYYLGDLAATYAGKKLVFALDSRFLSYLEVLRWKSNLTLMVIDSKVKPIDMDDNEYKYQMYQEEDKRDTVRLNALLKDKHCRLIRVPSTDHNIIAKALSDIFQFSYDSNEPGTGFLQAG